MEPASDGATSAEALLKYVRPYGGQYRIEMKRSKHRFSRYGPEPAALAALGAAWHAKLDADGVAPTRQIGKPVAWQSDLGVRWKPLHKTWRSSVYDRLASAVAGVERYKETTGKYRTKDSDVKCAEEKEMLQEQENAEYELEILKRVAANPLLKGLPRAGHANATTEAERTQVHWNVSGNTTPKHMPYRAVVRAYGTRGFGWFHACDQCANLAIDSKNRVNTNTAHLCVRHGGGRRCPGPKDAYECPFGFALQHYDPYDGRCMHCFCSDHPEHPKAIAARSRIHAREQAVVAVLKKEFPGYNWTFDKSYHPKTFLRGMRFRPDARTRVGDRVVLVEIDEDSHRSYLCAKEREREASFVATAGRESTVVMIRFNPDKYVDYAGKKWPTCFLQTTVNPKQQKQWQHRVDTLVDTIRHVCDPDSALPPKQEERPCLMIELFYDNITKTPEEERTAAAAKRNIALNAAKKRAVEAAASTSPAAETGGFTKRARA
jgi:hypothetical protein